MSQYCNITLSEMEAFLQKDKGWKKNDIAHKEVIFDFNIPSKPFLLVRVYSGIKSEDQQSRACGKDAIRVIGLNLARQGREGWIKASRVYRVHGWQNNLKTRVIDVINRAKERLNESQINQNSLLET